MYFRFGDFLQRWVIALVLVMLTYNPTQWSYVRWVLGDLQTGLPYKALAGLVLLVGYIIFLRATFRSIGIVGIVLVGAFFAVLVWVLADLQLFDPANRDLMVWVALLAIATIMGVGVSWSHVRRRISGQADMDDVDQ
ncbi:MAG: DUF6524 family protein [Minwuia sp.]|uniref:DUF6524 family protein n=1 Tax=Minwuia sp. TaxID=2493630 RepID=UPI003A8A2261